MFNATNYFVFTGLLSLLLLLAACDNASTESIELQGTFNASTVNGSSLPTQISILDIEDITFRHYIEAARIIIRSDNAFTITFDFLVSICYESSDWCDEDSGTQSKTGAIFYGSGVLELHIDDVIAHGTYTTSDRFIVDVSGLFNEADVVIRFDK